MSKKNQESALSESGSKPASANVNPKSAQKIRASRKNKFEEEDLLQQLLNGNKTALGRAITLVESNQFSHRKKAQQLLEGALPYSQKSIRIGITGVPGVGKSTFIESFGSYLLSREKK